jgi:hypothetical protein
LTQGYDIIIFGDGFSIFVKVVNIVFRFNQPILDFNLLVFSNYDVTWINSSMNDFLLVQMVKAF